MDGHQTEKLQSNQEPQQLAEDLLLTEDIAFLSVYAPCNKRKMHQRHRQKDMLLILIELG